jgi:glycosyltransferase involved in cell wall biosynthesis
LRPSAQDGFRHSAGTTHTHPESFSLTIPIVRSGFSVRLDGLSRSSRLGLERTARHVAALENLSLSPSTTAAVQRDARSSDEPQSSAVAKSAAGSRPLTIAYLASSGEAGGAERVILEMVSVLRTTEPTWPVHVVTVAPGPLADRANELGATVWVRPFPRAIARFGETAVFAARGADRRAGSWSRAVGYVATAARLAASLWPAARYVHELRALFKATAADVVHSNGIKMHLLAAWAHPRETMLVWHLHDYLRQRPLTMALLRRVSGGVNAVIANSESVASEARDLMASLPSTVVAIHNSVDLSHFSPNGPALDLDAISGLPEAPAGVIRVGLVATFARWKGHETFLRALSDIGRDSARHPQVLEAAVPRDLIRGYVIGGPVYETTGSQYSREELRELARELGIGDRVGFTGFLSDSAPALRALDIVVHASTRPEPFGLVIAEAMACGRPIIVSDAGGAREIVDPGVDAQCTRPGDVAGLARLIEALASDPRRRAVLGAAARKSSERRFSRDRLASQLVGVYLSSQPRPR